MIVREIGKPMPRPFGLVLKKGIEDVGDFVSSDAVAGIAHGNLDGLRSVERSAHTDEPISAECKRSWL
jgi:hypothetical protein